jgi:hypothetical protein
VDTILSLSTAVSGPLVIGGTILISIATYAIARMLLISRAASETKDLAGSVIFRVSALHGLILALVFAQELVNLAHVRATVEREGALIGDVFFDLKRYDGVATIGARKELAAYTAVVLGSEWEILAEHKALSSEAWGHWEAVYGAILDLEPQTLRQEDLRRIMLTQIREISGLRRARENAAATGANPLFVTAALIGVILTAVSYFTYPPNTVNILLLSIFGAYTGLVIYFIIAFANPYREPGAVEPVGLERIFAGELGRLHEASK